VPFNDHLCVCIVFVIPLFSGQSFSPAYEKLAKEMRSQGLFRVGAVDCDADETMAGRFEVRGFPSILVFQGGATSSNGRRMKNNKPIQYKGMRSGKAITEFAISHMPDFTDRLKSKAQLDEFVQLDAASISKAILFTNRPEVTPLWKTLSTEFRDRISFAAVLGRESDALSEEYGVSKVPGILVFHHVSGESELYEGAPKYTRLHQFLEKTALPVETNASKKSKRHGQPRTNDGDAESEPDNPKMERSDRKKPKEEEKRVLVAVEDDASFRTWCPSHLKSLCILSVVGTPGVAADAEGDSILRERVMSTLQSVVEKNAPNRLYRFGWISRDRANPSFFSQFKAFDVEQSPLIIAMAPAKKKAAGFVAAPTADNIQRFLGHVVMGAVATEDVDFSISLFSNPTLTSESSLDAEEEEPEEDQNQTQKDEL
jgi:protein disulfide-isomerase A6